MNKQIDQMELSIFITDLYNYLILIEEPLPEISNEISEAIAQKIAKFSNDNSEDCVKHVAQKLFIKFKESSEHENIQKKLVDEIRELVIVSSEIVRIKDWSKYFAKIDNKMLKGFSNYINAQKQSELGLKSAVLFIEVMFLEKGYVVFSSSQPLFQSLVHRFIDIPTDRLKQIAAQFLIEMMVDNKKLVPLANDPYYFMEYWLHMINMESQLDRQIYWIECVKKLYSRDLENEDLLFHSSDFRVFIDLLVRVISECSCGKTLRVPLECYLVMSCSNLMMGDLLRIKDIRQYLSGLDCESLGVQDIAKQIAILK